MSLCRNLEYVLLLKDDKVVMAVKRLTHAAASEDRAPESFIFATGERLYGLAGSEPQNTSADMGSDANAPHMLIFDNPSTTRHSLIALSFVRSSDNGLIDADFDTLLGFEPGHLVHACESAIWWQDWEHAFRELVATDRTLTPRQIAEARIVLDCARDSP
jgi:hypothetical protein